MKLKRPMSVKSWMVCLKWKVDILRNMDEYGLTIYYSWIPHHHELFTIHLVSLRIRMSQSLMILLYFRVFTYLELISNPYSEAKLEIYVYIYIYLMLILMCFLRRDQWTDLQCCSGSVRPCGASGRQKKKGLSQRECFDGVDVFFFGGRC